MLRALVKKYFLVLCQKSEIFHGNPPVSLKLSPGNCTTQFQCEVWENTTNRQPWPDNSCMRFTVPAWMTEIRELDICLPTSSATELFIHLERVLFCFVFPVYIYIFFFCEKYMSLIFLSQLHSNAVWVFACIKFLLSYNRIRLCYQAPWAYIFKYAWLQAHTLEQIESLSRVETD